MRPLVLALTLLVPTLPALAADPPASQVDAVFAEFAKPDSPGCAVGVYRDGRVVYSKGYGSANLELGVPINPKTVFYVGSVSKQFTAGVMALLAQQGKISLDDDVRKWVPEVPDFGTPITIRHLIHHTSGLREKWVLLQLAGSRNGDLVTLQDVLDLVKRQKALNFKPGDEESYSNTGYDLLAVIVERVTGKTLRQYAQENLLGPLGMKDSLYGDDRTAIIPRRADAYSPKEDGGGFLLDMPNVTTVGSGGLYTTVEDLAKWDENYFSARVGGRKWIEQILTPGTLNSGGKMTYAFGVEVTEDRGLPWVWHNGGLAGYLSTIHRYPSERFAVSVLCNTSSADPDALARKVTDLYLAGKFKEAPAQTAAGSAGPAPAPAAVTLPAQELEWVTGTYLEESSALVRRIVLRDGKLVYVRSAGPENELAPLAAGRFVMVGAPVRVEVRFEPAGARPERMIVEAQGQPPSTFEAVTPAPPGALDGLAGTYWSEELGTEWSLAVKDGGLVLKRPRFPEEPLQTVGVDLFEAGGLLVRVLRTEGRVTGISANTIQARDIRFARR